MKITLHTYVFFPERFLINEFAEGLIERNIPVVVSTGLPNYPKGDFFPGYSLLKGPYNESYSGIPIKRYPITPRKKGFILLSINYLSHILSGSLNSFRLGRAEWAFVFGTSPITTAIAAIVWAKLHNAKICIWLQDLWPDSIAAVGATSRNNFIYKIIGHVVRWIYKHTDLILVQSPGFYKNLQEFGYLGPSYLVPNWAPSIDFSSIKHLAWLPQSNDSLKVVFAGNIGRAQAIDTVVRAAAQVQNDGVHLYLVGDGSDLERINAFVDENNIKNVTTLGRRPLEEMPSLFAWADILLVSLKDDPIFAATVPGKVQAYMAAGKPLMASLSGIGADLIETAKCGLTAPAENADELAKRLREFKSMSSTDRQTLGDNARSYFYENFRKDRIIDQIIEHLERHR